MAETKETAKETAKTESNVKCSFCGNDTFCGVCKKDPSGTEKFEHICYDCYVGMGSQISPEIQEKTHTCIPPEKAAEEFGKFLDGMTGRAFEELWAREKKTLRDMSKQDLAQASFFEGARFMFQLTQRLNENPEGEAEEGDEGGAEDGKEGGPAGKKEIGQKK